jgi:hypothetical protein
MTTLSWRSVPYDPRQFFAVGTEIAVASVPGTLSRFAIYETRGYPRGNEPGDVFYTIRDASTVGDDDVRVGKRPKIVNRFSTPDEAVEWSLTHL